jgi:SAM-dependent methyltransferase
VDQYWAEVYDRVETQRDDVALLRTLIRERASLRILEPFCGNGRILIPLAEDGHELVGMDRSQAMLDAGHGKIRELPDEVRQRITLRQADVTAEEWPRGFDVVVFGANCFYELASAQTQEGCIRSAAAALVPGGRVFVDNNDYQGDWGHGPFGRERIIYEGGTSDGSFVRYSLKGIAFDAHTQVLLRERTWLRRCPDGVETRCVWLSRTRPVSAPEVRGWLGQHGFRVLQVFGDRSGNPHRADSDRAIFRAHR